MSRLIRGTRLRRFPKSPKTWKTTSGVATSSFFNSLTYPFNPIYTNKARVTGLERVPRIYSCTYLNRIYKIGRWDVRTRRCGAKQTVYFPSPRCTQASSSSVRWETWLRIAALDNRANCVSRLRASGSGVLACACTPESGARQLTMNEINEKRRVRGRMAIGK